MSRLARVAGYLAKYATKSAGDPTATAPHTAPLRRVCTEYADAAKARWAAGDPMPSKDGRDVYLCMANWVNMLGFRGHFASKARDYSITLGRLRRALRRYARLLADPARKGRPLDVADLEAWLQAEDDEETTLVVGSWRFAGTGWPNTGDEALAAAERAREYDRWRAEQHRS